MDRLNSENYPELLNSLVEQANQLIIGKPTQVRLAICCLLSGGHLLIEDLPGMGKTSFVMVIAKLMGLNCNRIQFTNDILPADILGTNIYDPEKKEFSFHKGPIFSTIVLGDELNRATPKTQSAFLEAMEEKQITVDDKTHPLPEPFFLIATQNPRDQAGTYLLPESQLDRFMMQLTLGFPSQQSEIQILKSGDTRERLKNIQSQFSVEALLQAQKQISDIFVSDALYEYVQALLEKSRDKIKFGGLSPRAGLTLIQAAKSWAYLEKRKMVLPEDIKALAGPVLSHRLNQSTSSNDESLVSSILQEVPVP